MRIKTRNLLLVAVVLVFGVAVWSAAAQDATAEPSATEAAPSADSSAPTRPFLGVRLEEGADGVSITEVVAGSAAAEAGVQVGDVITAINGTAVATVTEVTDAVRALAVGDQLSIDVTRAGEAVTLTATLGEQAAPEFRGPEGRGDRGGRRDQMFGLEYNSEDQTWTLTNLSEDNPLYAAGLREGDVITSVDGSSYDPAALGAYLMSLEADATVTLSVERDGAAQDIQVNTGDLTRLFMPRGFNFGFERGDLPEGFPERFGNVMPMLQSIYGNGYLGVSFQTIDADLVAENTLTVSDGALVQEVVAESPAAAAGVLVGDVITAVNGEAVDAEHTLRDRMIAYEAGDTVTLTVLRDGASQELQATLVEPQAPDMRGMFENMIPFEFGEGGNGFPFGNPDQPAPEATAQANA